MTNWKSDTCNCYVDLSAMVLINQCSIHNKAKETLRHNNILNLAFNESDTFEIQKQDIQLAKQTYFEITIESQSMIDRFRSFFGI